MSQKTAIIIGGGPAGLTAAYEFLHKTDVKPIVLEMSDQLGGISKTVNYKGNRIDIGGHRFFSKSDTVMNWWQNIMPIQGSPSKDDIELEITYQKKTREIILSKDGPDPEKVDAVMLIRNRLSRIFFLRKFFNYPITLSPETLKNLGLVRVIKIGFSYVWTRLFPIRNEKSLEDFFINRFGRVLYGTFFRDYTEKVWGIHCREISSEWGAQRIKGLSISKAILHALKNIFGRKRSLDQKDTETSLIENFMYPKHGPGQMWEEVGKIIIEKKGDILYNKMVTEVKTDGFNITGVSVLDRESGKTEFMTGDYFFSTMPMKELVKGMDGVIPEEVKDVAEGLIYRDFITVGLLLDKLKIKNTTKTKTVNDVVPDNWIYIQEKEVKVGRLQVFNNWSPYMVADKDKVWIGLEYFCNEGDDLWSMDDDTFIQFGIDELVKIDIIEREDVVDHTLIRVPKTYPAYFGSYDRFDLLKDYISKYENLFLVGRNGMHKYNNQDHSMLTAITAVDNIKKGIKTKTNIWDINTEMEYHEEGKKEEE